MATIEEVKAELERRGAIMPAERPCGKLTGDGRYWQFMFYEKDGGCTWDYVGLQDMSKPAAAIVDRMWPESRNPPRMLPSRRLPKPVEVRNELLARGAETASVEYQENGFVKLTCTFGESIHERLVIPPGNSRVTPQQIVDMAWSESETKPVLRETTREDAVGRELAQWLSETLSGSNISVTVLANGRVLATWINKSGAVLAYDSGRDKITAQDDIDDILCGRVGVVGRNAGTVSLSSKHPGPDADTLECGGWNQPDVERDPSVPATISTLRGPWLDNWASFVGADPREAGESDGSFRRRLTQGLRRNVDPTAQSPEATCADCGSGLSGDVCEECDNVGPFGVYVTPFIKDQSGSGNDLRIAAGADEADVTPGNLRDNIAQRLGPKVCETIYKHRQPEPITVTSAEQYRKLFGREPEPWMFPPMPAPILKLYHPEPETAEQWASHNSDPVEDMQRGLDRYKQRNAPSTPEGITDLIRSGIAPHEYPHRTGKIELGSHGDCRCILCALLRGKSWGEVELQRRIEWMGQQVHESLHAVGAWIHRGKTKADEAARYTDPSLGIPFDSTGRYRDLVRDALKGPLFSQRQKGSINGK